MNPASRPIWLPDTKGFLAIAIIALFAGVLLLLLFGRAPTDDKIMTALMLLLGVLVTEVKEVYGYFFGSSASSASKDETQTRLTEKLTNKAVEMPAIPAPGGPFASPMER